MARKDMPTRKPGTVSFGTGTARFEEFVRTDDQVRSRAYEIYQARRHCGGVGDALADWIAAECELKERGNGDREVATVEAESGGSGI